jgi:allene oxide cyclase-like protein
MTRMLVVLVVVVTAALLIAVNAVGAGSKAGKSVTVIEHATTDATTDTGIPGDTSGDVLTFANEVFDKADKKKVGSDQGSCVRIVPGESYECMWTTKLAGGQITVQGPFYDTTNSTLAITGGTGRYRNARGTMSLTARDNGAKYVFAFHVIG